MRSLLALFLSPWGLALLATLDASVVFFLPFALDAVVVLLAAQNRDLFWIYPLIATAGSLVGARITYWIGGRLGETALERFVSRRTLERAEERIGERGAVGVGLLSMIPPPFPFTPYIVGSGALEIPVWRFFGAVAVGRLARFSVEAALAARYGQRITAWMETTAFEFAVGVLIALSVAGTAWVLWRAFGGD